jgi:hypothetical protein
VACDAGLVLVEESLHDLRLEQPSTPDRRGSQEIVDPRHAPVP